MKKIVYFLCMIVLCSDVKSQWQPDIFFDNTTGSTSLSKSNTISNNLVGDDISNLMEANIDSGLIAYYPFENNANDYSGNNFHASFQNSANVTAGVIGNGVQITENGFVNGNGGHVLLPISLTNTIKNLNNYSISLWVKEDYMNHYHGNGYLMLGDHNYGMMVIGHLYNSLNGTQNMDFATGVSQNNQRIQYPFDNNFIHRFILYSITYDNGELKAYINGNYVGEIFQPTNIHGVNAALGKHWWDGGTQWATRLLGVIDDVRFYDRTLSQSEIQQLFSIASSISLTFPIGGETVYSGLSRNITWTSTALNSIKIELTTNNGNSWSIIHSNYPADSGRYAWTVPNLSSSLCKIKISDSNNPGIYDISDSNFTISPVTLNTGLIAYYPFNGNANDESGNNNHGTNFGATLTTDVKGIQNKSYSFNGVNNYIEVPDLDFGNLESISWHALVYPERLNVQLALYYGHYGQIDIFTDGNNKIGVGISLDNQVWYDVKSDISSHRWYDVTAIWKKGNYLKIYINGVLAGQNNSLPDLYIGPRPPNHSSIGAYSRFFDDPRPYKGKVDEIRVYSRELTTSDVQDLYLESTSINITSPVGGEINYTGVNSNITWTSLAINSVKIELTTNNGNSWSIINSNYSADSGRYTWTVPSISSSQCKIKISDVSNPNVYDVSDSIFSINEAIPQWVQTGPINGGSVYSLAASNNHIFAGTSNGIFLSTNNGNNWIPKGLSSSSINVIKIFNNNVYAGSDGIYLSTNYGSNWIDISSNLINYQRIIDEVSFIGTTVLIGTFDGIFKSTNNGSSWVNITNGISGGIFPNVHITALEVLGNNIIVTTNDEGSGMHLSTNFGNNWTNLTNGTLLGGVLKFGISGSTIFAGTYGSQIRRSTDIGTTWEYFGRPSSNILSFAVYGNNVFAGGGDLSNIDAGVFLTQNNGVNWTKINHGLQDTLVRSLAVSDSFIFAGTNDSTIWKRPLTDLPIPQSLSIIQPIGGESLQAGSTKYISWNIQGNISQLKIDFSSNNGSTWTNLSPSWNTTYNTYPWHVPNISSDECKIRLNDAANQSVSVTSGKFSISTNDITDRLTFKIKDPLSLTNRIRLIQNSGIYKEGNIVNGTCVFNKSDLTGLLLNPIKEIQILNSNMLVGHINFEYKLEYNSNKKVDVILYVDSSTASEVGYYENPEWKYFSNSNEHLVYMLIPPFERIDSVRYFKKPLLFVHGFTDTYPNWGKLTDSLNYEYNGWQLYYPNDMGISHCSKILKKALYNILSGEAIGSGSYGVQKMNVVAYSMGGLVSRNYIQSLYYSNDINKLLMLGVPNNGSLSTYCLRHEGLKGLLGKKLGKDENSPASIDLSSGSSFLNSLNNNSDTKVLFNNSIKQSYLVIAGTKYFWKLAGLHHESKKQEDGVVSVSSASLLNKGIPLTIVDLDHSELPHQIPVNIINSFFEDTYNPPNVINFINNIDGFWLDQGSMIFNKDNDLDTEKGILYLGMDGVDLNLRNIQLVNPSQHSFVIDFNSAIMSPLANLNVNPENKSIYFTRRNGYKGEIGLDLNSYPNPIVTFTFGKTVPRKVGDRTIITYKPIARRLFYYYSLQTNWRDMNFTASELFHINGYTRINNNLALQWKSKDISSKDNSSQNTFYIDGSIDTISFYLSSDRNDINFQNNNFKLYDPNNTLIDSNYANQNSNVDFEQDLNEGFAYYYIVNPTPGNWSVEYNPNLTNPFLDVPIQSDIIAEIQFPDTSSVAGDSLKFTINLSKPINYTNIQLVTHITCIPNYNYPVQDLGNVNVYQINDSTYEGKFLSTSAGEYLAELDFNCLYNNENVLRKNYASKNVISLKPPVTVFPKNDSLFTPQNLRFKWNKSRNATRYQLVIYQLGDTIPSFNFSDIRDTLYRAEGLTKQTTYMWRVRASLDKDSSSWSDPKVFTTTIDPPTSPDLDSPPDNSGGLSFPLTFNWLSSNNATRYHIQISADTGFVNLILNDSTLLDTSMSISNLSILTNYYWRVRAANEGGKSEFSNYWSFRTIEGSYAKIKLTPEGLYNVSTNNLQRRDTLKCFLMNSNSPFNIVDSSSAALDTLSFEALFEFRNALPGTYYLKLNYKNLIETWSTSGGEIFTVSDTLIYDFTSSQSRAFGNNLTLKNTVWCIYSGDVNQDANIDLTDLVSIFNDANNFATGYFATDLTGDFITDLTDLIIAYNNSSNFVSVIKP